MIALAEHPFWWHHAKAYKKLDSEKTELEACPRFFGGLEGFVKVITFRVWVVVVVVVVVAVSLQKKT